MLEAARLCADLGHTVEEAVPDADCASLLESWKTTYFGVMPLYVDIAPALLYGTTLGREDVEPLTWATAERARTLSAVDYQVAAFIRQQESRRIAAFHERWDVWLTPTLAQPPVATGTLSGMLDDASAAWDRLLAYFPFTPLQNATGQPSISLPLYWNDEGLPIGTMFTSAFGTESVLLRLAAQLEEAKPWRGRTPQVWG